MPSEKIHSSTLRVKISVCLEHNKSNQDKTPTFQKNLEKVTNLYDKINACTYNQKTKLIWDIYHVDLAAAIALQTIAIKNW